MYNHKATLALIPQDLLILFYTFIWMSRENDKECEEKRKRTRKSKKRKRKTGSEKV